MNIQAARAWLVKASLFITALSFAFFLLAPVVGYPLSLEQTPRLLEIITPVFLGYIGNATYFVFGKRATTRKPPLRGSKELMTLLLKGPICVFGIGVLAAVVAFGYSNRAGATQGTGMSVDTLAGAISGALALLTVTTNVIASYLFSTGEQHAQNSKGA